MDGEGLKMGRRRKPFENKHLITEVELTAAKIIAESTKQTRRGPLTENRNYFFPRLIDEMGFKTCVEVGVDKGNFSLTLVSKTKIDKLYGIDIWQNPKCYEQAVGRLREGMDAGRVILIKDLSVDAAKTFENNSVDFVYIDGDHSLEGVYRDIRAWMHKVRIGGVIAGHDYKNGRASGTRDWHGGQLRNKVKVVIDDFCPRYGYKLHTIRSRVLNWWIVKNKECEAKLDLSY